MNVTGECGEAVDKVGVTLEFLPFWNGKKDSLNTCRAMYTFPMGRCRHL